ncbi:hypothetical protein P3G55_21835 [Leptospira sp. 96542]|nr:hypothetical protein [Leptospira sp. 96542]
MNNIIKELKDFIEKHNMDSNPYFRIGILRSLDKDLIGKLKISGEESSTSLIDKLFENIEIFESIDLFRTINSNILMTLTRAIFSKKDLENQKDYYNRLNFKYYRIDINVLRTIYETLENQQYENEQLIKTKNELQQLINTKWSITELSKLTE